MNKATEGNMQILHITNIGGINFHTSPPECRRHSRSVEKTCSALSLACRRYATSGKGSIPTACGLSGGASLFYRATIPNGIDTEVSVSQRIDYQKKQ